MKKIIPLLCSMMLLSACSYAASNQNEEATNNPSSIENAPVSNVEEPLESEEPINLDTNVDAELHDEEINVQRTRGYVQVEPLTLSLRTDEATITDSGRVHQKMDIAYLDYDYKALAELGYIYLDVVITFEAKEVNDGYQYLFIYNTSDCQSAAESLVENFVPSVGDSLKEGLLAKEQFEIGAGKKKTSWEQREFHYVLSTEYLIDDLFIRYGANGILEDTWVNKNVVVTVQPKQTKN